MTFQTIGNPFAQLRLLTRLTSLSTQPWTVPTVALGHTPRPPPI
jgi:hypothetical protein